MEGWWGFPDCSVGKESACNTGDPGLIPGLGRSPGERNNYPLQYSGLENSMDCIKSACGAGDPGSIRWLEKSPGVGNGNPLQYSCLKNPMDRGAWPAIVPRVNKGSDMTEYTCTQKFVFLPV